MLQPIALADAELMFDPQFLALEEAADAFEALHREVPWEVHRIRLFGREVVSPRRSCWFGDPDAAYTYSGMHFPPRPWTPAVARLRERIAAACDCPFNSVLANLYRDGRDAMGWHSDDEPELGPAPVIASLSLGVARGFRLRHRRDRVRTLKLELTAGSLLLMRGATQRNYRHAVPRTARAVGARINLTFRTVRAKAPHAPAAA
ncbi:MAG TPA: alpha-ketoglutarate-dependent dioxygenase AlkB [Xanthomonadaceae bacterium]|nr:alpha-ketoglutarate-dependent dioxygenase AlkB [Xanthomonadaceae bacterium]